jgi:hypothetical protein
MTQRTSPTYLRDGQNFVTNNVDKANLLNSFFHSVFTTHDMTPPSTDNTPTATSITHLPRIQLTVDGVMKTLQSLDPKKASGPDEIPGMVLKNTAQAIAPSLCRLFNLSLGLGTVPTRWKCANVTPVHKRDDASIVANYRPISLLSIISKTLERCVFDHCYHHLSPHLYHLQHGFQKRKSTVTQLITVYHDIVEDIASGHEVDVIHLDLSKAFDKVSHHLLLSKLQSYGISGSLLKWFKSYLCDRQQRVVLDGVYSDWLPVLSGVPQGSILGPLLFLVYVNDMPNYVQGDSKLALFADDSKLYKVIKSEPCKESFQDDIDRIHRWSIDSKMSFNASKCKVLNMSKKRSKTTDYQCHLGNQVLHNAAHTKDLGVTVSSDLTWNKHIDDMCAKAIKNPWTSEEDLW